MFDGDDVEDDVDDNHKQSGNPEKCDGRAGVVDPASAAEVSRCTVIFPDQEDEVIASVMNPSRGGVDRHANHNEKERHSVRVGAVFFHLVRDAEILQSGYVLERGERAINDVGVGIGPTERHEKKIVAYYGDDGAGPRYSEIIVQIEQDQRKLPGA